MRLYSGMSTEFVDDTVHNRIAGKLADAFFAYYRFKPSPSEVQSWRNSLRAMAQIIGYAKLTDHGILLEYQLPLSSKRLDCMICGHSDREIANAIIIELKQWDRCDASDIEKVVLSWVGGRKREVLHPSVQVGQYQQYLQDCHSAFYEEPAPIRLSSCAYLHNYFIERNDPLLDPKFEPYLRDFPLFPEDGADNLASYLSGRLVKGGGRPVLDRIERSRYRSSRKLMDHVAAAINSRPPWILLDEQLIVFEKILATVNTKVGDRRKQVVIVRGGPGTGKSVIAINLLADLLKMGVNAHYATGSRAFTETLWNLLGNRSKAMFKYFNSYSEAERNAIDVLICDESHRIRETSNSRYTPKARRSSKPQLQELLSATKVGVFLIDDRQVVRPNEIGSTAYLRRQAEIVGADVSEYELDVQFRCAGSEGFVNWINNTLGVERTANVLWDGAEGFDFQILDSPQALDAAIRQKVANGFSARVAAGFCWPWSKPRPDGTLVDDVVIGDYKRPWDAKPGNWRLAPGIPSASLWATDPNGIDQVGCVYNIQGFELDYVGVIWGRDLTYSFDEQCWIGNKKASADNVVKRSKDQFADLVKNTYRVLLSRGIKGCFVHFMDKDTERFIRSRMEPKVLPFRPHVVQPTPEQKYVTSVPLIPLRAAAGAFGDKQHIEEDNVTWVVVNSKHRLRQGMFVTQVVGMSMEPTIPDGSYCLFSAPVGGTRQGKIVLVQLRDSIDPETGERYTVKRYESSKSRDVDSWQHAKIMLRPINPTFKAIELTQESEGQLQVIAEFVEVLTGI